MNKALEFKHYNWQLIRYYITVNFLVDSNTNKLETQGFGSCWHSKGQNVVAVKNAELGSGRTRFEFPLYHGNLLDGDGQVSALPIGEKIMEASLDPPLPIKMEYKWSK